MLSYGTGAAPFLHLDANTFISILGPLAGGPASFHVLFEDI